MPGLPTIGRPTPLSLGNGVRLDQTTNNRNLRILNVARASSCTFAAWLTMNTTKPFAGAQTVFSFTLGGINYNDLRLNQPSGTTTVFTVAGFTNPGTGGVSIVGPRQFALGTGITRHYLALTVAPGRLSYYCDGQLVVTSTSSAPSGTGTIGIGAIPGLGNYLAADVHEFRYYERELTSSEIVMRYLNGQASNYLDRFEQTPAGIWLPMENSLANTGTLSALSAVPFAGNTANGWTPTYVAAPDYS